MPVARGTTNAGSSIRLVDAVEAGDTDAKPKLGQRLLDGIGDDNWDTWRFIDVGQFLPLARLEPANLEDDDLDRLYQEGTILDARINDVLNGGGLHDTELARWREIVVERAFDPGEFDREILWLVIDVGHSRRVAYIAGFGYDLEGLSFAAAYSTYTETVTGLKSVGFTGPKDYQARSASVLARTSADQGPGHARALPSTNRSSSPGSE